MENSLIGKSFAFCGNVHIIVAEGYDEVLFEVVQTTYSVGIDGVISEESMILPRALAERIIAQPRYPY